MSTAVDIRSIVKSFGSGTPAVGGAGGVSLRVAPGELFFLLGPSGCGKTTLLRMIAGFTEPTSGKMVFETPAGVRDVTDAAPNKRNTGMVFQSYALWPHMTIAANVAFGLEIRKVGREERERRVREALALVQMEQYGERKPNQLSGGQQQRVALARALVVRPDVLLLDEPLSNLDAKLRVELRGEIRRICKQSGITTVYVTHDQKEALSMADRVAIMCNGDVVQMGAPGALYRRPGSTFVAEFLGETNFLGVTGVERGGGGGEAGGARVQTSVGWLEASVGSGSEGGELAVSIRPEAVRILGSGASAQNTLRGRIVESTYLGEIAQHVVELEGGAAVRMKVSELNPGVAAADGARGVVTLGVDAEDVVVVAAGGAARRT